MSFRDFDELAARVPKRLPLGGRLFHFPDRISADTGRLLLGMQAKAQEGGLTDPAALLEASGVTDEQALAVQAELLGSAHEELIAAGYGSAVSHVVQTLTVWHLYGEEAAEKVWNSAGPTPAPSRAARRSKAPATSTPSAASRGGTTPRKRAAAPARRGGSS